MMSKNIGHGKLELPFTKEENPNDMIADLDRWDMTTVEMPAIFTCIGATKTGKSFFCRQLCYYLRNLIPLAIVISGTERFNNQYKKTFPDSFIYDKFDESILHNVFDRQEAIKEFLEKNPEFAKKYNWNNNVLVMADDVMHDKKWAKDELTTFLFIAGRHAWTSFIYMMQYPLGVKAELRGNIKYVFMFRDPAPENVDRMWNYYAKGVFPDKATFDKVYHECTKDYRCLVIDRSKTNVDSWKEQVFWYKADAVPDYKFGSKIIWDYHQRHYCKGYKKRNREKRNKSKANGSGPQVRLKTKSKSEMDSSDAQRRKKLMATRKQGLEYIERGYNNYGDRYGQQSKYSNTRGRNESIPYYGNSMQNTGRHRSERKQERVKSAYAELMNRNKSNAYDTSDEALDYYRSMKNKNEKQSYKQNYYQDTRNVSREQSFNSREFGDSRDNSYSGYPNKNYSNHTSSGSSTISNYIIQEKQKRNHSHSNLSRNNYYQPNLSYSKSNQIEYEYEYEYGPSGSNSSGSGIDYGSSLRSSKDKYEYKPKSKRKHKKSKKTNKYTIDYMNM